ncbi:hypothetical protein TNCV_609781 [Trichonephila clavipes]|nr:hypothetical protein TNCV_609781 [Trichonephila clavipes]
MTPELAPPLLAATPHQREDVSALDRFGAHRCPARRVFSGTGLELLPSTTKDAVQGSDARQIYRELKPPPVGVALQPGEGEPAQVSSTSLDHGSKLRGPLSKALV